jgi:Fe-coproporphyrin III synthase
MGPTGSPYRVLQVHPTRRCNLSCVHCYSSSGPMVTESLSLDVAQRVISGACEEGYNVLGTSGGEPLLYRELPALLEHAKSLGMTTTVTSNGMLLDERRIATLMGRVDLLAISVDGTPAAHDELRGSPHAFRDLHRNLAHVRASGIPFGFIFTLTLENLDQLAWVARFAIEQGAGLLQVHPLELSGRGEGLAGCHPDDLEAAAAYLECARLQAEHAGKLRVQLDLVDRLAMRNDPGRVYADACAGANIDTPLGAMLSPLVLESDGTLVPVQHGFARQFALGSAKSDDFRTLARNWKQQCFGDFRQLCREVFETIDASEGLPFVNWYEVVAEHARNWRRPASVALA